MKKTSIIILFVALLQLSTNAQTILSHNVIPAHPTPADTITIITQCMFPSGSCDGMANVTFINGNIIHADAMHCMGMLTVICTDFDTVVISPRPAGQYSFIFSLSAGHGFPCTPGIAIDDIDTLLFVVEDLTSVKDPVQKTPIQINPNPSTGRILITNNSKEETMIRFFSIQGNLVKTIFVNDLQMEVESQLPPGIYFIDAVAGGKNNFSKLIITR